MFSPALPDTPGLNVCAATHTSWARGHAFVVATRTSWPRSPQHSPVHWIRDVAAAADACHTRQIPQAVPTGNFVQVDIHCRQDTYFTHHPMRPSTQTPSGPAHRFEVVWMSFCRCFIFDFLFLLPDLNDIAARRTCSGCMFTARRNTTDVPCVPELQGLRTTSSKTAGLPPKVATSVVLYIKTHCDEISCNQANGRKSLDFKWNSVEIPG